MSFPSNRLLLGGGQGGESAAHGSQRGGGHEVQGDARLVTHDPSIVTRGGDEGVAWPDLHLCAVLGTDGHAARDHIADVLFRLPAR